MKKQKKPASKAKKIIKAVIAVLLIIILVPVAFFGISAAVCTYLPGKAPDPSAVTNPYITEGNSLVSAHRSGGGIAPENTMMAFKNCIESEDFNVDVFEFDLHITKDGQLILLHDDSLDRTTDSAEKYGADGVTP